MREHPLASQDHIERKSSLDPRHYRLKQDIDRLHGVLLKRLRIAVPDELRDGGPAHFTGHPTLSQSRFCSPAWPPGTTRAVGGRDLHTVKSSPDGQTCC